MDERTELVLNVLTPTQRKRMEAFLAGQTLTQIAKEEGVHISSVAESIESAKKRAKKRITHP